MALTINPVVSGSGKRCVLHSVGFLAGVYVGALFALVAVVAAASLLLVVFPREAVVALAVTLILWGIAHDVGLPAPLLYRRRQVPEWFRRALPPGTVAVLFGFQLGAGVLTLFTYSTHLAMLAVLPFLGSTRAMLIVVALFALGKTVVLLVTVGATAIDEVGGRFHWTPVRARLLRAANAAVAAWAAVTVVSIPM
jgi:hypothetical protein